MEKHFFPFYLCVFMRLNDFAYTLSAETLPRLNMTFTLIWSRRNGERGGREVKGYIVYEYNTRTQRHKTMLCSVAHISNFKILQNLLQISFYRPFWGRQTEKWRRNERRKKIKWNRTPEITRPKYCLAETKLCFLFLFVGTASRRNGWAWAVATGMSFMNGFVVLKGFHIMINDNSCQLQDNSSRLWYNTLVANRYLMYTFIYTYRYTVDGISRPSTKYQNKLISSLTYWSWVLYCTLSVPNCYVWLNEWKRGPKNCVTALLC